MQRSAAPHQVARQRDALTVTDPRMQGFVMTASPGGQSRIGSRPVPTRRFPAPAEDAPRHISDVTLDYAYDPPEPVDGFVHMSDNRHFRISALEPYAAGWVETCGLSKGFLVCFGELGLDAPYAAHLSWPDSVQVIVASDGDGEYVFPDGDPLSFEAPNAAIVIEPAGQASTEATFAGCNRYVAVVVHREALKTLLAGSERELPATVQAFLADELQSIVARTLPLSAHLLRCLEDLHACTLEGRLRRLFLQSKAVEIVCRAIEALGHANGLAAPETTMLTARGVLRAQRLLTENAVARLSVEDLAREVGLSRSALCAGFRQILGQSVFDYTQGLRMEQALALLNERDASITQIAYAVGYKNVSSFSVAVARHFGDTPTEIRRRGASAG